MAPHPRICVLNRFESVIYPIKKRQSAGRFLAGTWNSCYGSRPLIKCGIWTDFRLRGTKRIVRLLAFLLRDLKAERCDFVDE